MCARSARDRLRWPERQTRPIRNVPGTRSGPRRSERSGTVPYAALRRAPRAAPNKESPLFRSRQHASAHDARYGLPYSRPTLYIYIYILCETRRACRPHRHRDHKTLSYRQTRAPCRQYEARGRGSRQCDAAAAVVRRGRLWPLLYLYESTDAGALESGGASERSGAPSGTWFHGNYTLTVDVEKKLVLAS